uniref:Uncharacterized protein n=1 Tax=Oryzias latipes TaxID=8090 RepID=A0A3P9MCX0_ORYLA
LARAGLQHLPSVKPGFDSGLLPVPFSTSVLVPSKDFPDVGIIIEGVVILQDLDNVALATAMLFGLFYCFNMSYLAQLRYTFEVIQKVVKELDLTELSRKAQNLKTKLQ